MCAFLLAREPITSLDPRALRHIWRAATLMLKRYGNKAIEQSRTRIDEFAG